MITIPAKNCQEIHHFNEKSRRKQKVRTLLIVKKCQLQNITKMDFEEPKIKPMSLQGFSIKMNVILHAKVGEKHFKANLGEQCVLGRRSLQLTGAVHTTGGMAHWKHTAH